MEKKMEEQVLIDATEVPPPYPEKNVENGGIPFTDRIVDEAQPAGKVEKEVVIDTHQLCNDLVGAAGKIWKLAQPRVREFTPTDIKNIAEPLESIVVKYDLTKYMKYFGYTQEFLLIYNTINVVAPRIKELKEPIHTSEF